MQPGIYNFTIYQGASDGITFTLTDASVPIDLSGYTAEAKFRRTYDKPPVLTLSSALGNIAITGAEGKVALTITPEDTQPIRGFTDGELELVYDVELTSPGGVVSRVLMGDCILSQESTR